MESIEIRGTKYPLCMTVKVAEAFEGRYGELGKVISAYLGKTPVQAHREALWQLAQLMEGGRDYAALVSGIESPEPISEEELGILCPIGWVGEIQKACMEAIKKGMSREVETEPDRKNGDATRKNKKR